jgi:hypothetical protein
MLFIAVRAYQISGATKSSTITGIERVFSNGTSSVTFFRREKGAIHPVSYSYIFELSYVDDVPPGAQAWAWKFETRDACGDWQLRRMVVHIHKVQDISTGVADYKTGSQPFHLVE